MTHFGMVTEKQTLEGHNLDPIEAYVARPTATGSYPGVVVVHHLPGWDGWTREVTRKFAEHGYAAVAPHLFSRWGPGAPDDVAARARASWGASDLEAMGDVAACARYLKAQAYCSGKVGCIGFCSGGRQAYLAASQVPELDAVVDCWGGAVIPDDRWPVDQRHPVSPIEATKDIHMPVLGIFGNEDQFPTPAQVDTTEAALKANGKIYEFYRYDGAGHGFWATDRPGYRVEQAQDSWQKVLRFYEKYLG
jgi:carboxymethylenebutenolidase